MGDSGALQPVGAVRLRSRGDSGPRPWISEGLSRQLLQDLETRLRCVCGARRASLEIRGLAEAPGRGAGEIHVFR